MRYLGNHPLFTGHPNEPHLDWINALFWHFKLDKKNKINKSSDGLFEFMHHLITEKKYEEKEEKKIEIKKS